VAKPAAFRYDTLSWQHENGGLEKTTAARISQDGAATEFITLLATEPVQASPLPDGVRVGGDEIRFGADGAVRLIRAGVETVLLKAHDIDLDRPQGKIGLFVPTVGYPFGPIPDWLIRQRVPSP